MTDGPSGGNDSASDESHPEAKRSRTEIGPPSPSASQLGSGDASAPAPAVCAPQPGAPHVQGPCDAPSAAPDGPSGTSTDFAAAAASAIAAAAASSSDAAPAASQPRDKASSDSTTVPSCGTAPTTEPIDDEDDDEDEDGEYDPTASQYVPGVQTQSLSDVGLGPSPQTRPSADEGSDGSLKLGQVAPTSTEVLTTKQSNDQSFAEDVGPPAVRGGAASLAAENDASAASRTPPGPATTADSASVVAVPLPVATAGAAASDAVAPGAVGTERSAATQPESSSPAATSSPSEPQPPNGATPSALDAEEPPSSPLEVASTSAEANSPPRASTPPPSSVAETEMDAFTDDAQAVHPPSPPIGSSSGQESLPESVMMESEDDEEEDGPPRRPVLPLPDKPALPSALKSRPPTTSLLPPTSASRAAQGPRKRVQWASEVASVALIENRPQLAEMWDTGPDAAEMPSQLLTPSPTPQGGDSMSAFEMAKKKERDSEQERMRAAKAALWTRLDRMAADIAYQTPPRLVLIPAGCESYDAAAVVSPHRDEVERQRRVAPSAEMIPDPRRFRSPPSPPLHSWTGPDDDAEVPVIPLDDVTTAAPVDQAAQPSLGGSGPSPAAAAGTPSLLDDPSAASSEPMSVVSSDAPGRPAAPQEPHLADGGANGVGIPDAAQNGAETAPDGAQPAVPIAGQAIESAGVTGGDGSGAAGTDTGASPGAAVAGRESTNRVGSLLGGLDLGKLQQLLGATNSLIGQQQRPPDDPYVPGEQPPHPQQQQLLPSRPPSQQEPAVAADEAGYVPSAPGGQPPMPSLDALAPPPGSDALPPGPGGPAAKNPAAQLSALLQLLTSQTAGSVGGGGPPLPQQPPPQLHGPPSQQPPPPGMRHNGGPVGSWGPGGGGGHMAHQMGNVHGAPMQPPPGMPSMPPPGMVLPGMPPPPHGRGGPGMGGPGMGGGMPPPHGMGPGGPHGMRPQLPPPGMGYPTGGQQPLPVVHFRHGQVGVHGEMGRGAPGIPPGGFDGGRGSGSRGNAPSQRGGGGGRRVNKPKNRVKCLFFNTPKGCRSGDACEYIHEPPGGGGDIRLRYASHR